MTPLKRIHVAAGILRDPDGRVLISERVGDAAFAGLWEFPGGKVDDGEAASAALGRELAEELGVTIERSSFFMRVEHDYADRRVAIDFFLVRRWRDDPQGREGQGVRWLLPAEISDDLLLPADAPVLEALRGLR